VREVKDDPDMQRTHSFFIDDKEEGFALIGRSNSKIFIHNFRIYDEHKGKGTRFFGILEKSWKRKGIAVVEAESSSSPKVFWEKMGFVVVKSAPDGILLMQKELRKSRHKPYG
jgi:hypothetical protein